MVRDLRFAWEETAHQMLDERKQRVRESIQAALIGWAKSAGRSPVVYLQPGDGPDTFGQPAYRRLVANALEWVSSAAARAWAAEYPTQIMPPAAV